MPEANEIISVTIGNEKITGFESVTIHTSLETLCGYFELVLTDDIEGGKNFKLRTQSECTIRIGDDVVMSGFIDKVAPRFGRNTHSILVRGRDKTGDLVDCSIATPPVEYAENSDLFELVRKWVAPFKITVIKEYDGAPRFAKRFCITPGETIAEVIIRGCKLKGVLPISDNLGRVVLTASGTKLADDRLQQGINVLEGDADFDYTNRFSKYTFRTQNTNSDEVIALLWGRGLGISGFITDPDVKRYRPIVMHAETEATQADCKKRAEVEALVRAAASQEANVMVLGWRQTSGKLWARNLLVPCDIPALYLNQELLISEATFTLTEEGTKTKLKLVRPDAFNPGTKFSVKRRSGISSSTGALKHQKALGFNFDPGTGN